MKNKKNSRYINVNTKLKLFSEAAGQCSMYDCFENLTYTHTDGKIVLAEFAHIEALNENGPRFNSNLDPNELNSEENLILLCPNCHKKMDSDSNKFTVDFIKKMKADHIEKMKFVKNNSSLNFFYDDLYFASQNIINNQIKTINTNESGEDYEISQINYKINKNDLTSFSKNNIVNGLVQHQLIEEFFINMSKEDEMYFDKVRGSLKDSYEFLKETYHGDQLFLAIYENFKNRLSENQQNACLAIIVYFFTICELFEK